MDNYNRSTTASPAPLQPAAIAHACETMSALGSLEARLESLHDKLFGGRLKEVGGSDATEAAPPSGDIRLLRVFAEGHSRRIARMDRLIDDLFNGLS